MMIQNDKTKYPKSMIIDWTKEFVPGTNFGFLFRKAKKNIRTFWQNQRCFEQLNRISNDDDVDDDTDRCFMRTFFFV